ncbi:MAG: nicotinate (nicotinamide) nucleotide adenylyltransferase [Candidatus Riflebacteria bacterium]|nr:nicotinate (nicotinamide) nucleotide adenylyltransferase [Candidatus Riflebacteria bacterium]
MGVLGGTFDPPHHGHLEMARAARDQLELSKVVLLPAPVPPHKIGTFASFPDRLEMSRRLVGGERGVEVWGLEAELPAPHYTVQTLRHLLEGPLTGRELFLIIGADSLCDLHLWKEAQALFHLSEVVAVSRPGYAFRCAGLPASLNDRVRRIAGLSIRARSRDLRRRLAEGEAPEEIPPPVLDYIRARGLYRQETTPPGQ